MRIKELQYFLAGVNDREDEWNKALGNEITDFG